LPFEEDVAAEITPNRHTGRPDAVNYAKFRSQSHEAVICVCDEAGNVIETHEHKGEFKAFGLRYLVVSRSSDDLDA
jgi:hypothetical protein